MEMAILMGNDFTHGHSHLDYTGPSTADEVLAMIKNAPSDVSLIGADVFPPLKENRFRS